MTSLKDINFGLNQYCGPSVLSALTGRSTDECAAVISAISGRQEIKAVQMGHLIEAVKRLRFDVISIKVPSFSLFGVLSHISKNEGMFIVGLPRHVVAVEICQEKIYFIDNHTKHAIDAAGSARLIQRVDAVYKVVLKPQPVFINSAILIERVDYYASKIRITRHSYFENKEDDMMMKLGEFSFKDENELNNIVAHLMMLTGRL